MPFNPGQTNWKRGCGVNRLNGGKVRPFIGCRQRGRVCGCAGYDPGASSFSGVGGGVAVVIITGESFFRFTLFFKK